MENTENTVPRRPVVRRRRGQKGSEIMEFALLSVLLVPTFLWMFITGMNLIRSVKATHLAADLGRLYINGTDFSKWDAQKLAQRLSTGLGLDVGGSDPGQMWNNGANGGRGVVMLSQVTFVGAPTCAPIIAAGNTCTNQDRYVFTQRIVFGNSSLRQSNFGTPTAVITQRGLISEYATDAGARASNFQALFPTSLQDGQFAYLTEVFFESPDLNVSALSGAGIYARSIL